MLYPEDAISGGSWIGVSDKERLVCLLNGGFEIHERRSTYRMSRGAVVKDFLLTHDLVETMHSYDLSDVEPFTLVIVDWKQGLSAFELVWDETKKHMRELSLMPAIWSSSTLYDEEMKAMRRSWFGDFLLEESFNAENILHFHKEAGVGDKHIDVVMDRVFVKTTSITQVEKDGSGVNMRFEDLATAKVHSRSFEALQV